MKQILFYIGMALLFILIVFACEFLGFLSPYLWVYAGAFGALLGAAPIMAMAKNGKSLECMQQIQRYSLLQWHLL